MKPSESPRKPCCIWINRVNRIISFHQAKDFERLSFPSQDAKLAFVMERCACGYRIQ